MSRRARWDHISEPDAATVIDELLVRYVEADLPGRRREHGFGTERPHGGDEGCDGQRRQPDRRAQAGLQQDPPGRDHQGTVRNRERRAAAVD